MYRHIGLMLLGIWIVADAEDADLVNNHPNWKYFDTKHCGITKYDEQNIRIVGGEKAKMGEFPWMVRLGHRYKTNDGLIFFNCAGTLINTRYVLTAAHCGTNNTMARIGEHDVVNVTDCEGSICAPPVQDRKIEKYFGFGYKKEIRKRDLMLVLLEEPVKFNEYVVPACLPRGDVLEADYLGKTVQIAGWGILNSTLGSIPVDLMSLKAPILKNKVCDKIYVHKLDESQFCAGYKTGRDSCAGDSGGPVTKRLKLGGRGQHYVLGIVSYGKKVCGDGPAVYTKVAYFIEDILDKIENY
ncbi:unnamed protein product [Callosobruchus maculatus]|uniref:Peptidase S1 domain-containing protein n=1 Tax=Callosobruchus maculatus TaxID=64391 RepID=A0A653CVB4_CALMS|nr:unnamed protein product [Callosobruchus maculatus]